MAFLYPTALCVGVGNTDRIQFNQFVGTSKTRSVNVMLGDDGGGSQDPCSSDNKTSMVLLPDRNVQLTSADIDVTNIGYGPLDGSWSGHLSALPTGLTINQPVINSNGTSISVTVSVTTSDSVGYWYSVLLFVSSDGVFNGDQVSPSGRTNVVVNVEPVIAEVGLFKYDGNPPWYIDQSCRLNDSLAIDYSLSRSAYYRIVAVGRLTQAAVDNTASFIIKGRIKAQTSHPGSEIWHTLPEGQYQPYPTDWYVAGGDPFGVGYQQNNLIVMGDAGSIASPMELPNFQSPASSSMFSGGSDTGYQITNTEAQFLWRFPATEPYNNGWDYHYQTAPEHPPSVYSIYSLISENETSFVPATSYDVWGNGSMPITLYPSVGGDERLNIGEVANSNALMAVEVSTNGGSSWSTLSSNAAYTVTLQSTGSTYLESYVNYNVSWLTFTALQPGDYYLRVSPTGDASNHAKSTLTQTVVIHAHATPNASIVLGSNANNQSRNDSFNINVTTNSDVGTYSVEILNPGYDTGGIADNLSIAGVGSLASPGSVTGLSGTNNYVITVPAYASGKATTQSFSSILRLVISVGSLTYTVLSSSPTVSYTRPNANLSVSALQGVIDLNAQNKCATGNVGTLTKTVTWSGLVPGAALNFGTTGSAQLSCEPTTYNVPDASGYTYVTVSFTQPGTPITTNITGCTLTATDGINSASGSFDVIACPTGPSGGISISYYGSSDGGLIFSAGDGLALSLDTVVYHNKGPMRWIPSTDDATESNYVYDAFFKLRDSANNPDTVNNYIVDIATNVAFSANLLSINPGSGSTWDVQQDYLGGILKIVVGRQPHVRGTYVANETAIHVQMQTNDNLNQMPVFYVRVRNFTTLIASTNYAVMHLLPLVAITDITGKDAASIYTETGAGLLTNVQARGTPNYSSLTYFASSGSPVFTLSGSPGLFAGDALIVKASDSTLTRQNYLWWETIGNTPGTYNIYVSYGATVLFSGTCHVVTKSTAVNLCIDGATASTIGIGATKNLTYDTSKIYNYAFATAKSSGAIGTVSTSGTPAITAASGETASILYGVLTSQTQDPNPAYNSNYVTIVAVKATVSGIACGLTSATPVNLVDAIVGTYYPPYIQELNGLSLPAQIILTGQSTPTAVTDWNFGAATTVVGGVTTPLNISGTTKRIGYPASSPTGLQFEIIQIGGVFKLRTYIGGLLTTGGLSTPLAITVSLQATVSSGCVAFSKVINVSNESCSGSITLTDLTASHSAYSCDEYPRGSSSTGSTGYDLGVSGYTFQSFIENGFATPSGMTSTTLPNYGLGVYTTKFATGVALSDTPVKSYAGLGLDLYNLYVTLVTNNGLATCSKQVLKIPYYKNYSPVSNWLPFPQRFFIGTSTTSYTSIAALYDGDQLYTQLAATISSFIEGKLQTDYKIAFTPVEGGASTLVSFTYAHTGSGGLPDRALSYTIPSGGGGLVNNVQYIVSVVHTVTGCSYNLYISGSPNGTVTYKGVRPNVSEFVINTIPALDPCFNSVTVTGMAASGLNNVAKIAIFDSIGTTVYTDWSNLQPLGTPSATLLSFTLPRSNTAFPTTRTDAITKSFKVQLYSATNQELLSTKSPLVLTLKNPDLYIIESNTNRSPAVGATFGSFTNNLTVASRNNTCCASCASGNCVADSLATATVTWASPTKPSWLGATAGGTNNTYELKNNTTIPAPPPATVNVSGSAVVTYYGQQWTVPFSYTLSPTDVFVIGTTLLPDALNGELLYGDNPPVRISATNKPLTSCATLTWAIINSNVLGTGHRPLPSEVSITADPTDSTSGLVTWPVVADPGAVFPVTYTFSVRATCSGSSASATGTITLTVTASQPSISSLVPPVGYFDIVNTPVTITGSSFDAAATVIFGGLNATSVVVNGSHTIITCVPPVVADIGGPDLPVTVTVRNPDLGSDTSGYTYTRQRAPILNYIVPSSGTPLGGTKVLITGANFEPSSVITIDGVEQPIVAITPSTILFITYPHSVGDINVVMSNSNCGGVQSVCPSIGYTFRVSPQIMAVTPFNISAAGGDPVFIVGTGFYTTPTSKPRVLIDNFEIPPMLVSYKVI